MADPSGPVNVAVNGVVVPPDAVAYGLAAGVATDRLVVPNSSESS